MIVGIGHTKRAGKDTAANALVRDLGFRKVAFADALKELAIYSNPRVLAVTPTVNVQMKHAQLAHVVRGMGWEQAKDDIPEVRRFLEDLGIGARKVIHEDIWLNLVFSRIMVDEDVVIADVRFPNEAEAVKADGGYMVRLDRRTGLASQSLAETSLKDWDDWDLILDNNGSIPELEAEIVNWVKAKKQKVAVPAEDATS